MNTAVRVVDKSAALRGLAIMEGLFTGVEHEGRVRAPTGAPANDPAGISLPLITAADLRGH